MARSDPAPGTDSSLLDLKQALALAATVVDRRASLPVLSCVRLLAAKGGITVQATDLDTQIAIRTRAQLPGKIKDIILPHRSLVEAVKETDGDLSVVGPERRFTVGQNPSVSIKGHGGEWPNPRAMPSELTQLEYPAADLATDLADVALAMSKEETRYYLNGVLLHVAEGQLRLAATDGHRLHRVSRPLPNIAGQELKDSIVPRKAVAVIRAALDAQAETETVLVEVAALSARFTVGAVVVTTRLIDGVFPDYSRVIPAKFKSGMTLDARELVRPAALVTRLIRDRGQAIAIRPADGSLIAKDPEGVEINARMERELLGEAIEQIGFRAQYLIDGLTPFLGQRVTMALNDAAGPAQVSSADPRLLVILMPMRI